MPFSNTNQPSQVSTENPDFDKIEGVVERITFRNDENGYTVAQVKAPAMREPVTAIGNFLQIAVGESFILHGKWTVHAQWGRQLQVERYEAVRPATADAIEKYLGSGLIKGIGRVMAKRIVAKFGADALDIIEEKPEKMRLIPGIGEKRIAEISKSYNDQREIRNIMVFLQSHEISPVYAAKIYKIYGARAIEVVENNPYQLAADIWGVGFTKADKIAREIGIGETDPRRIQAGVAYVLDEAVQTGGNAYLTEDELIEKATAILGPSDIAGAIRSLATRSAVICETRPGPYGPVTAIYPPLLFSTELGLAEQVKRLAGRAPDTGTAPSLLGKGAGGLAFSDLSEQQQEAVEMALRERFSILTGGPGVGKTTATNAIVAALEARGKAVLLASPTGRAAKRLAEVTGREAKTVHRLLEFDPETRGFKRNGENPLHCDAVIVDECSMLDMLLTHSLLKAVPESAQVLFVGDVDQLPSVGPGNVLRDLIESSCIPVTRLTTVFRQAAESLIITNAHRINGGAMPILPAPSEQRDCAFVEAEEADEVASKIVAIVCRSLPRRGFKPEDVQVLAPMQRGSAGAVELNRRMQEALNPPAPHKAEATRGNRLFRVGDRVMQIVNNYDKGVFNGDIGVVRAIDSDEGSVAIAYPDAAGSVEVQYELTELDELSLAYATSIHKSQGSEYPVVVLAIHTQHYMLLQRNLLYTAITRARKFAVIVGTKRAIGIAVKKQSDIHRHTRLKERLAKS